jgi:hypothetical protein
MLRIPAAPNQFAVIVQVHLLTLPLLDLDEAASLQELSLKSHCPLFKIPSDWDISMNAPLHFEV